MILPRVLITRAAHQAAEFVTLLQPLVVQPLLFPTIEIRPTADLARLDDSLGHLHQYDWLLLTSANTVSILLERLALLGINPIHLAALKIGVVGPATAAALTTIGLTATLMPTTHTAEALLAALIAFTPLVNQRILLPQADIARPVLAEGLAAQGAQVTVLTAYQTMPITDGLFPPEAEIITFTSSSTVQGYVNCLAGQPFPPSQVICIGPSTAQTAYELGVPVTITAQPHTLAGMVAAVKELRA